MPLLLNKKTTQSTKPTTTTEGFFLCQSLSFFLSFLSLSFSKFKNQKEQKKKSFHIFFKNKHRAPFFLFFSFTLQ